MRVSANIKMKIITFTPSVAYDIHCRAQSLALNKENKVTLTSYDPGGKGVNLSRALLSLGKRSAAIAVLGEDNMKIFLDSLKNVEIDFIPVITSGRIRENVTVHTDDGKETRISFDGGECGEGLADRVASELLRIAEGGDILAVSGRIPEGMMERGLKALLCELREMGVRIVIDSRSVSKDDLFDIKPFLVKPNEEELEIYTGVKPRSFEEALKAADELISRGVENVLVSLGSLGAVLKGSLGEYSAAAPKIEVISTIGAGDSALAGFIYAYSEGMTSADCLKYAVASGSAACLTEGTCPPEKNNISDFLKKMQ